MRRLIGAAVAAVGLAWAGSAASATHILGFESYDIGDTFGGSGPYTHVEGSPYRTLWLSALVTAAPGGGVGNVARLNREEVNFSPSINDDVRYTPLIESIDIFMPGGGRIVLSGGVSIDVPAGEWFTWAPGFYRVGASHEIKITSPAGYAYIDNVKITDFYSAAPEPTTWAVLTAGFGLAGAALRRLKAALAYV